MTGATADPPTLDMVEVFGGHFMTPVADPYPAYTELRRRSPVAYMSLAMGPGYVVTRYEDVVAVLRDASLYSSRVNADGIGLVMGRTILEMDGKEHGRHRAIASTFFMPKTVRTELPPVIASIADRMIDEFARDGRADLVAQFARTFPLRVIAHVIGIPIEDYETFQEWAFAIIGFSDDPARGYAAAQSVVEFLRPIVEERRQEPRSDLMSTLAHAEVDGHRLSDEEVYSFLRLLLPAGAETTYRLIGTVLFALLRDREALEEVRSNRGEIAWAIEEALRWEAPVCFAARETTRRAVLAGTELPSRAQVLVAISSANRDERRYADPDRFDLHRRAEDHVAFGFAKHYCLGSHLARLEATAALNALFDRLQDLRLEPSSDPAIVGLAFRSPNRLPVTFRPR